MFHRNDASLRRLKSHCETWKRFEGSVSRRSRLRKWPLASCSIRSADHTAPATQKSGRQSAVSKSYDRICFFSYWWWWVKISNIKDVKIKTCQYLITRLKEQCHEIFDNFNFKKTLHEQAKSLNEIFRFREDIRNKRVSAYEYANIDIKCWRPLTDFTGTVRRKLLACVNVFNSNILISWKWGVT